MIKCPRETNPKRWYRSIPHLVSYLHPCTFPVHTPLFYSFFETFSIPTDTSLLRLFSFISPKLLDLQLKQL